MTAAKNRAAKLAARPVLVDVVFAEPSADPCDDFASDMIEHLTRAKRALKSSDAAEVKRARAVIVRMQNALYPFDPDSIESRRKILLAIVDLASKPYMDGVRASDEFTALARGMIAAKLPGTVVDDDVLRSVLTLDDGQRKRRTAAVRALARALDCDSRSLMTQIRQARKELRKIDRPK